MEKESLNLTETEKSSRNVYNGRIISLKVDEVVLPDGKISEREYVCHRGGASVLAVDEQNYVYLVRQFRYPYREELVEIPAGKLEDGESAIVTAARELEEEIGMTADEIIPYGVLYPTPGYTNERLYVFLAKGLKPSRMHLDDGEFLRVERTPFADVLKRVTSGEIRDGKTCFAVLKYALLNGIKCE